MGMLFGANFASKCGWNRNDLMVPARIFGLTNIFARSLGRLIFRMLWGAGGYNSNNMPPRDPSPKYYPTLYGNEKLLSTAGYPAIWRSACSQRIKSPAAL